MCVLELSQFYLYCMNLVEIYTVFRMSPWGSRKWKFPNLAKIRTKFEWNFHIKWKGGKKETLLTVWIIRVGCWCTKVDFRRVEKVCVCWGVYIKERIGNRVFTRKEDFSNSKMNLNTLNREFSDPVIMSHYLKALK